MERKIVSICLGLLATVGTNAREVKSFCDGWEFQRGKYPDETILATAKWDGKWQPVSIPHTWNNKDMQSGYDRFYQGEAYYRKQFDCPTELKSKRVFLRFEGVGACAKVYVNKRMLGTHKGAYSAFAIEISEALKYGEVNEIVVLANNEQRPDVIPVNHRLFGVYGGIYRPVQLIVTEKSNITVTDNASPGVYVSQTNVTKKSADISVNVKLDNADLHATSVSLETVIYTQEGKQVAKNVKEINLTPQGSQPFTADFRLKNPHLWQGREDPYLYKVVARLVKDGKTIDEVVQPLGVRHYEMVAGKGFYLNGEKYPMYGVCRHQDYLGLGSALTNKHHDNDLADIMEIGATTVRFAHYQQSDYLYSRCDSLGLVIWAEIPFVNQVTGEEAENAKSQLREMIRQSYNHPSIYVWGLHNEVYSPTPYTAQLTAELHDLAKTEDPYRYTVSVNGYGHVEHSVNLNADIQAMNRYYGWYEGRIKDIDKWVDGLTKNYSDLRLIFSEYGAEANIEHHTEILGESLNAWGNYYPEEYQTKFHEYQWNVIANHPVILASYLWNMFDFCTPMNDRTDIPAQNTKGLITFDRKIKKDSYYWYKANWSKEPTVYLTQRRNTQRERKNTTVTVYSNIGTPKVYLNGQELTGIRQGYTVVHFVFDNVTLADGKNTLKAVAMKNGKEYVDEIEWNYNGERDRSPEHYLNEKEHVGL